VAAGQRRPFTLEQDLPRLEEVLRDYPETKLVVIDPIAAYCGKVDSHKNTDVRGLLAPLSELASRYHVAIVAVTHLSKTGGTKAVYRAMGSLAFAAAARAVWAIVKDADDPQRRLFLPAKLNLARDPDGLA
jgi:putative DNA primase/helicase